MCKYKMVGNLEPENHVNISDHEIRQSAAFPKSNEFYALVFHLKERN